MIDIELLKNKKPRNYPIYLIVVVIIILLLISYNTFTYDKINTIAITNYNNNICNLNIKLPYTKINNLEESIIEYNNNKYKINEVSYNESTIENDIIYEDITLNTNINCKNKIIKINILSNKQRIINKIINIIKEA